MGVSINGGTPKWMVDNGKSYWNGWFGGTPILGNLHIHIYIYTYTLQRPISFNLLRCRQLHDGCHLPVWLGVPRSGSSMTNKCCFVQEWVADGLTKLMFVLWCLMSFLRIELSNCGESFWTTSFFFRLLLVWDWPLFFYRNVRIWTIHFRKATPQDLGNWSCPLMDVKKMEHDRTQIIHHVHPYIYIYIYILYIYIYIHYIHIIYIIHIHTISRVKFQCSSGDTHGWFLSFNPSRHKDLRLASDRTWGAPSWMLWRGIC